LKLIVFLIVAVLAASGTAFAETDCSHDAACLSALVHGPDVGTTALAEKEGFTPGLQQPPTNVATVWLPKGTLFPVQTMQSYSSYSAAPGGKIRYELVQNVIVNGYMVAMKGDTAEGTVQDAMTGEAFFGFSFRGANLRVSVDKVYNFCGDTIAVDFDRSEFRRSRTGLDLGDVDVHVIRSQQYMAFADRPQHVCGVAASGATDPANGSKALWTTTR
jgi:hypothetical protein